MQGLKDTILSEPPARDEKDDEDAADKNEEAYAELIQYLDDKRLSLVMRDTADDGRKALQIYYAGKGKPQLISLYTELTSLQKVANVEDYVIRAETALRNAEDSLSERLSIALILTHLKHLPSISHKVM